jgi:hypothetical protein
MNRIQKALLATEGQVRSARANQVILQIDTELGAKKIELNNELRALQAEKAALMDMGPDQTTSLRVTSPDFSAKAFVIKMIGINARISELMEQRSVLVQTIDDIFGSADDAEDVPQEAGSTAE